MSILSNKIKKFPLIPGVYIFIGKNKKPLYIGKAASLRRRVESYPRAIDPKIQEMVSLAKDIKFYKTDSVLEAVILEANLIKKHWPKYNVKEKDNRSFIYIAISKKDVFPKPIIIRGREIENLKLKIENYYTFGPYQSQTIVNNALKIIRRIFPYSTCQSPGLNLKNSNELAALNRVSRKRACFNYQIGLCPGVCIGAISKKDYQKNIKNIILLLSGKKKQLLRKLQQENPGKARALQHISDVALIQREPEIENLKFKIENSAQRIEGYDISHLSGKETYGSMVVFENNESNKNEYRLFKIKQAPTNDDLRALAEVIERRFNHNEWQAPDLIMIDGGTPQISYISKVLDDLRVDIPIVGISKYGGDELVFPLKTKKNKREEIKNLKSTLLKVRDEAHRFALKSSRYKRRIFSHKGTLRNNAE